MMPSSYAFICIVALSVSMSARTSPSLTWSPTFTSHWAITPVSIVGLSFGIVTSMGTSLPSRESGQGRLAVNHVMDGRQDSRDRGQHGALQGPVVGDRGILAGDPPDRRTQLVEDALG